MCKLAKIAYKKSTFRALFYDEPRENGRRRQRAVTLHGTYSEVCRQKREILEKLDKGVYAKPQKLTVSDYLKGWLENKTLAPSTRQGYKTAVNQLIQVFGGIRLTELTKAHIQNHFNGIKRVYTPRTVIHQKAVLHTALETALEDNLIAVNPADKIKLPPKSKPKFKIWNAAEVDAFCKSELAKTDRLYTLFYTALCSGMRRSEICGLTWGSVDLLTGSISVNQSLHRVNRETVVGETKSNSSRRLIDLPPSATKLLNEHWIKRSLEAKSLGTTLINEGYVFSWPDGTPLRPNYVTKEWTRLIKECGLPHIKFHEIRHTHASLLLAQGVPLKVIQERLGHYSISLTSDTYSHLIPGMQKQAAVKFDEIFSRS